MAAFTFGSGHPFPAGTTVSAYEDKGQKPEGSPSGPAAVSTGLVSGAGALTIAGLSEAKRYWAVAQVSGVWKWVQMSVPHDPELPGDGELVRGEDLAPFATRLDSVESGGPQADTADATMDDAVAIQVGSLKKRRIPIADKAVYDLREFYSGSSQPADMVGHIHDGWQKTADAGGSLLVPDSEEPWMVSETLTPPPNARWHGPHPVWFSERLSGAHSANFYDLPATGKALGEAWVKLANGANCPILRSDYDNSEGKRGPARGNGAYWQWFSTFGIVLDANGKNNPTQTIAVDIRDAWGFNFAFTRLVDPRGEGFGVNNCNECHGEMVSALGSDEPVSNGTGDIASSVTVSNAGGTWAIGDMIYSAAGIAYGTYITNVVGATLTLSAAASATATGVALSKTTPLANNLLVLRNSTNDSEWNVQMHHSKSATVLLDSSWANRVRGFAGYARDGHNLWLRNTFATGCFANKVDMRLDQARKHNCRIDSGVVDNVVDTVGFSPGIYNNPVDADAGWANVFCDGQANVIRGAGEKGIGLLPNMASVVVWGANSSDNEGQMGGGTDLPAGTALYASRAGTNVTTNRQPGPDAFTLSGPGDFVPRPDRPSALATFNTVHKIMSFVDGSTTEAIAYFEVPNGVRLLTFRFQLVNLTPANTGNVYVEAGWRDVTQGSGQALSTEETTLGPLAVTIPANTGVNQTTFTGTTLTVNPGDTAALFFRRYGAHANDTLVADIGLVLVRAIPIVGAH